MFSKPRSLTASKALANYAVTQAPKEPTHHASVGKLVFYDSMSGLVPARIAEIKRCNSVPGLTKYTLEITSNRGRWKRGNFVETSGLHTIPRDTVRQSLGVQFVRPYVWV